jgi:hypothetical protein
MWFLSGAYVVPMWCLRAPYATLTHTHAPSSTPCTHLGVPWGFIGAAYGCLGGAYGCLWVLECAYGCLGGVGLPRGREGLLGP